jgi:hypothetical protein
MKKKAQCNNIVRLQQRLSIDRRGSCKRGKE